MESLRIEILVEADRAKAEKFLLALLAIKDDVEEMADIHIVAARITDIEPVAQTDVEYENPEPGVRDAPL